MSYETSHVLARPLQPSASYSFTMRLHMTQQAVRAFANAIADAEAMLGAIDVVRVERVGK